MVAIGKSEFPLGVGDGANKKCLVPNAEQVGATGLTWHFACRINASSVKRKVVVRPSFQASKLPSF